ncbi:MAG: TerC family protein [Coriobacteriia bacterium]|nr:TerC family protein [Coriobacteriia bacterium]
MDLSIFATSAAWVSLITLIFLEIVLGIDNLVFIAITTNRLPENQQRMGRRIGLVGALIMRILFLCLAAFLVQMTNPLFTVDLGFWVHGFSLRDLVLLAGGLYLIYKGVVELRDVLKLTEVKAQHSPKHQLLHQIGFAQAIVTIMIMDLVFSIDSVITAVALADHLIIMIIAVMLAVILMMIFINPISDFINKHFEMKILALTFIIVIGGMLVADSFGFKTGTEIMGIGTEKAMIYFAMLFSIVIVLILMAYKKRHSLWLAEVAGLSEAPAADLSETEESPSTHANDEAQVGERADGQTDTGEAGSRLIPHADTESSGS